MRLTRFAIVGLALLQSLWTLLLGYSVRGCGG